MDERTRLTCWLLAPSPGALTELCSGVSPIFFFFLNLVSILGSGEVIGLLLIFFFYFNRGTGDGTQHLVCAK